MSHLNLTHRYEILQSMKEGISVIAQKKTEQMTIPFKMEQHHGVGIGSSDSKTKSQFILMSWGQKGEVANVIKLKKVGLL